MNEARHTLQIIKEAKVKDPDLMFPDYYNSRSLSRRMTRSLLKWPDQVYAQRLICLFRERNVVKGMQLTCESVYYHIPQECSWSYLDD